MAQKIRPASHIPPAPPEVAFPKDRGPLAQYISKLNLSLGKESRELREALIYLEGRTKDSIQLWTAGAIAVNAVPDYTVRVYEGGLIKFATATLQVATGGAPMTVDVRVNGSARFTLTVATGGTSGEQDSITEANRRVSKGDILDYIVTAVGAGATDLMVLVGVA